MAAAREPSSMQCWICLAEDNPEDLITPCGCRGTMQHVHEQCLKTWLGSSVARVSRDPGVLSPSCPNCQQFYNIQGSPGKLNLTRFFTGLSMSQRRDIFFRIVQHMFLILPVVIAFSFKVWTLAGFFLSTWWEGEGALLVSGPVWGTVPLFSHFTSPLEGGTIVSRSGISEKWSQTYIAIQRSDQWKVMCWVVFEVFGFLMEFEWHELLNEQPGLAKKFMIFEVLPYAYNRLRVFSTLLMSKCQSIPHIGPAIASLLQLFLYSWYTSYLDVGVNCVCELLATFCFTRFVWTSLKTQYAVVSSLVLLQSGELQIVGKRVSDAATTELGEDAAGGNLRRRNAAERGR